MIGTTLGHFRINALLGEGGMGAVYRAEDTRLGREVAIKVLPEEFTADAERLARFEREAHVVASLNHANICALYDVGSTAVGGNLSTAVEESSTFAPDDSGQGKTGHAGTAHPQEGATFDPTQAAPAVHYLVMELVEGAGLDERIDEGLSVEQAVGLALQVAEALEAAHAQGIVHRDLKPANVKVTPDGQVKVLDFGLAKAWEPRREAGPQLTQSPTLTAQMTQAGVILGTAAYMSPEQARGEEADQRADVWSWGVMLYEMLVGEQLFAEPTVSDTLAAVLRADFDWDVLPEDLPPRVRQVLLRTLERDPKNRLHAIADARIELTSQEMEAADASLPAAPERSRSLNWLAAGVAIAGVVIGALGWWTRPPAIVSPLRIVEVAGGGTLMNAALSPDGQRVVLSRRGRLYIRELDSAGEVEIPSVEEVDSRFTLFWSPDGRQIGYTTPDAIYTVPLEGGQPRRVCEIPQGTYSDGTILGATWWGPDTLVFSLDARGLWQVPARGGRPELLQAPDRERDEGALHHPRVLPDGKTLLARVRWAGSPNDTITFIRDGERTDIKYEGWEINDPAVTPSGHLLFVRNEQDAGLWSVPLSLDTLRPQSDPVRLLDGEFNSLTLGSDDTLMVVAAAETETGMVLADRQGNVLHTFEGIGYARDPAVSPNGSRLAVWGVRVHDGERTIDVTPGWGTGPTWSPDGREIIYADGRQGLFRVPADGSREPEIVTDTEGLTPHWSPDGKRLAFSVFHRLEDDLTDRDRALGRTFQSDIAILSLDDAGDPQMFRDSPASEMYARFSPNGEYLAYASNATGRFEIYVTPFPDGDRRWQVSVDGGRFPRWSPNSDEIFFVAGLHLMAADLRSGDDIEIGSPRRLISTHDLPFSFSGFGQSGYDVTPLGQFAARFAELDDEQGALMIQNWPRLLERAR